MIHEDAADIPPRVYKLAYAAIGLAVLALGVATTCLVRHGVAP